MKTLCIAIAILIAYNTTTNAQANAPLSTIDVLSYNYTITVQDATDSIYGKAIIQLKPLSNYRNVALNLQGISTNGKGMLVTYVTALPSQKKLPYTHSNNVLTITADTSIQQLYIAYQGIPSDGLIIGKNKFGSRTWFGDNWPNRAQHWLPCVDAPADKATVNWTVQVPNTYSVTANGVLTQELNNANDTKVYTYTEAHPIPTKVMTIGVAQFQKSCNTTNSCVPICNLYYPETYATQPTKMQSSDSILLFFTNVIGAYPYAKLNNVQSTTMFGGMENANNIFYDENAIDGKANVDALIAHEIAHQWWGNTVTEKDYSHIWLSEGFATFFTNYYLEKKYGTDTLNKRLAADAKKVKAFLKYNKRPVIDTTTDYMSLLNANSYEKGGLFLQALRLQLGDAMFFNAIKKYYTMYKYKNVNTTDFKKMMTEVSGKNLDALFYKWLYTAELPGF